jgi:cellulose biosynthesis protein BcsQ
MGVIAVTKPYILAVASHKGGTGRTTSALTLAWALGESGHRVILVDADEQRSASALALDSRGQFDWANVEFRTWPQSLGKPMNADIVVIDPPALTSATAAPVLAQAHGIVLTCLADPLSIRTVPAAATVIEQARAVNPLLELLGILICIYDERDAVQSAMLARLQQAHGDLLLNPPVPLQSEIRSWALKPGSKPPLGAALEAYASVCQSLEPILAGPSSIGSSRS